MKFKNPRIIITEPKWFLKLFNYNYDVFLLHTRDVVTGVIRMSEPTVVKSYPCKNRDSVKEKINKIQKEYNDYNIDVIDRTNSI